VFLLTICFVLALLPHQSNAKAVVQRRQAVATIQNNWVTVCAPGTGSDPNFTNNNQVQKRDDSVMTLNDMHSKPTRTVDCSTATATKTPTATSAPDNNPPPKSTGSCNAQCWNQYLWSKYYDLKSTVKGAMANTCICIRYLWLGHHSSTWFGWHCLYIAWSLLHGIWIPLLPSYSCLDWIYHLW